MILASGTYFIEVLQMNKGVFPRNYELLEFLLSEVYQPINCTYLYHVK